MISITNNGASIQLNGDQNVTIVKKDVTKVQAIGINVLIVRKTNGVERKTAIPYTSVNVPSIYPTAQALADYISSILGGFDTSSFIENSNLTYVAQVITSPFPIPDTDIENSDASYTASLPSADPTPFVLPDTPIENSDASYTASIPSASPTPFVIPDNDVEINGVNEGSVPATETVEIDLEDSGGNPVTPTSVTQLGNTFTVEIPSSALTVDFTADDTTPDTNQTVTFTDLTVGATDWLWDFGDGNCSTLQNPTHAYKYAGTYTVTLFASNGTNSGLEVKTNYIVVTLQAILATDLQASYVGADYNAATGTWTDITGGFNLTQANAANRPAKLTAAINGLDAVQSDGNDFLINTSALFDRSSAEQTMAFVLRHDVGNTAQRVLAASNTGLPTIYTQGGALDYRIDNPTNRNTYASPVLTYWSVVIFGFSNAGNAYVLINDQLVPVANTGAGGANSGLSLFGSITGTLPIQCSIAELRIYNTLKTGADRTNIVNYLKSKYGLW